MVVVLRINKLKNIELQAEIECSNCESLLLVDKEECVIIPSDSNMPIRYKIKCPVCNDKIILYVSHFGIFRQEDLR